MRRREGRGSRARVVSVPHSMSLGCWPGAPSTTPYPRTAVPGSMPNTFTSMSSGFGLGQLCCVDIEVGENLGDVIQLFENIQEPDYALGIRSFDAYRVGRDHGQL